MGAKAAAELKDSTYEERTAWIESRKAEGNNLFKDKDYDGAIDKYIFGLCGFDFKKTCT